MILTVPYYNELHIPRTYQFMGWYRAGITLNNKLLVSHSNIVVADSDFKADIIDEPP